MKFYLKTTTRTQAIRIPSVHHCCDCDNTCLDSTRLSSPTELLRRQGQTVNYTCWGSELTTRKSSGIHFWFQLYHDNPMNLLPNVDTALSISLQISSYIKWKPNFYPPMYKYQESLNLTPMLSEYEDIFLHHFCHSEKCSLVPGRNGFTPPKTCEGHSVSISSSKCQPGIKAGTVLAFWTATSNCNQRVGRTCLYIMKRGDLLSILQLHHRQKESGHQSHVGSNSPTLPQHNTDLSCSLSGILCHPQSELPLGLVYQQLGTGFNPFPVHHTLFYPNTSKAP